MKTKISEKNNFSVLFPNTLTVFLFFLFFNFPLKAEIRAIWVPVWDLKTAGKIDTLVAEVKNNHLNQILAEVRYRGDAMYFPNKTDSTFSNPEERCYVLSDSLFDPLAYLIGKAKEKKIEVYAWVTTFVVTPHKLENITKNHIYYRHPEWITADFLHRKMSPQILEGAYLDPGIPEVREYLKNIFLDIVKNYEIDGIQLDYIRYPGIEFGYNQKAREIFKSQIKFQDAESWQNWKEKQINLFVRNLYNEIKSISPKTKVTAAVISKPKTARERYSQNWIKWLQEGYLDKAYLMAYETDNFKFSALIDSVETFGLNKKIVVGLRAWSNNCHYSVSKINEKIEIIHKRKFAGLAFFSYSGIKKCNYFEELRIK